MVSHDPIIWMAERSTGKFKRYKKLNSISRARLNFRRRPILCTTLYRNPMQASNFGGKFDQLFLWILLWNIYRRCLSTSSIPWCKKVKNDQKLKSRGSATDPNLKNSPKRPQSFHVIFSFMVKNVSTSSRNRGIGRFCEIMMLGNAQDDTLWSERYFLEVHVYHDTSIPPLFFVSCIKWLGNIANFLWIVQLKLR